MSVMDVVLIFLSGVMSTLYYEYTHGKIKIFLSVSIIDKSGMLEVR